ncbi:MAG: cation diffusion facilitator family transporter [Chloroflexi bacterium]|nr:cation diffusion facilitator family transporter [Chloroflexota bacterium]
MQKDIVISNTRSSLTRFAWLSIAAALTTITLKSVAYLLTGSVGLLSDAVESIVNLLGAIMALGMLTIAARPADDDHSFGHSKAEYFASVVEGLLILVAAGGIAYTAIERILHPRPLEQVGIGLVVSIGASVVNFVVARILMTAGKKYNSITLEADSQHLMTDVWTSVGVIGGIGLIAITGWERLDPIVALIVAVNIVWTGLGLVRRSVDGLMDVSLPGNEREVLEAVMAKYRQKGVGFHALRTRQAASRRFISVHMLVPGAWTVHDAHHVAEDFEGDIRAALSDAVISTHLEPVEDHISMDDIHEN